MSQSAPSYRHNNRNQGQKSQNGFPKCMWLISSKAEAPIQILRLSILCSPLSSMAKAAVHEHEAVTDFFPMSHKYQGMIYQMDRQYWYQIIINYCQGF